MARFITILCCIVLAHSNILAQFAETNADIDENHTLSMLDFRSHEVHRNLMLRSPDSPPSGIHRLGANPGLAYVSSLLVPGLGQAANDQWVKAGIFAAIEVAAISLFIINENNGRSGERLYQSFAHDNFSVIRYAQWMIEYNNLNGNPFDFSNLTTDGSNIMDAVADQFSYRQEWNLIDLQALNNLERHTLYYDGTGVGFSHFLDGFGSQQYYELISKYFQYGPGWADWWQDGRQFVLIPASSFMTPMFLRHAQIGDQFNRELKFARYMIMAIAMNHFVSAFDALISNKLLQQQRVQASVSLDRFYNPVVSLGYSF